MLVLFETPAGYGLFKVGSKVMKDTGKIEEAFASSEKALGAAKLEAFSGFQDTADAVAASASMMEGKLDKDLKKFLQKFIVKKGVSDKLAVADTKLAGAIKEKLEIDVVSDSSTHELMRGIRSQLEAFFGEEEQASQLRAMRLGLSHSLSRYKLKFSADKVDTMIVQAIGLLDELDKEINTYAMRVREWYGWHFPEMAKILNDNMMYAKCCLRMGTRDHCKDCDFSDIIGDEVVEGSLKANAEVSMGTEITDGDLLSIKNLARQVVDLSEYRAQLYEYLRNRMAAIAPNLTIMVGELVGARLIAHAGSLLNLAKQPASTVQILGAEKALFRALKTKHDTPKYGLIYHASLIGQTAPKNKGKISRVLAAKTALAIRVDAMGEGNDTSLGLDSRAKVEARIRQLEGGGGVVAVKAESGKKIKKYDAVAAQDEANAAGVYNEAEDFAAAEEDEEKSKKKKKKKDKKEEKNKRTRDDAADEDNDGGDNDNGGDNKKSAKKKKKSKTK